MFIYRLLQQIPDNHSDQTPTLFFGIIYLKLPTICLTTNARSRAEILISNPGTVGRVGIHCKDQESNIQHAAPAARLETTRYEIHIGDPSRQETKGGDPISSIPYKPHLHILCGTPPLLSPQPDPVSESIRL